MGLMGTEDPKFISLQTNCWTGGEKVADEDNAALALSFSREELEEVLTGTKTITPHFLQTKLKPLLMYLVLGKLKTFGKH
jgi:hypothetical protein